MYRDPFTAVVMEMPVTARTSEDGSRTLSESSHTPTRNKNISYKSRPKFVHCYSPIWLFQLSCLSCWGRKTSCSQTLFIHLCLPQHLLGWIGSLLVHNQGAQTPCFSPSWCVMKSQGPPSGWARTQAGPLQVLTKDGDIGVDSQYQNSKLMSRTHHVFTMILT